MILFLLLQIDKYKHPENIEDVESHCYRIYFSSTEQSLSDEDVNVMQDNIRATAISKLNLKLR